MRPLALPIVGLIVGGVWGHTDEVLSEPYPTLSINQDGQNYHSPEPDHPESSIVSVEDPSTVESTVLPTAIESEHEVTVEAVTPCETTESALPTVPYESVPESVYYHPPIESEDITATPVEATTPCDTTQPSVPTVPFEPVTESYHYGPPSFTPETTSPSHHVQTMTTESEIPCTESSADAPIRYSEPEPVTVQPTIQTSKAPEPSKNDVPKPHPPISIPSSKPVQHPIPTVPIHTPVVEPTVIIHTQTIPSTFKTVTSTAAVPTDIVLKIDLSEATLGLYATFIEIDGRRAIRLAPTPNGTASFTIEVNEELEFPVGSFVSFEASITVGDICPNTKRNAKLFERADKKDRIQVYKDNRKRLDQEAKKTNGKVEKLKSNRERVEPGRAAYTILQNGGSNPVGTTFDQANIRPS
ncbi:hypothetical protein FVEN_g6525 [Fusarium venenatum]|uniref:Uncharacterized protein n=1 Tax=Fusarium venenatum TaxID=56646 RepID=A0A2L2SVJ0_9HYPO|nr:uncharacterized protein FVRRES_04815 [Fusarium venenatum]KAG8355801.1 hypothetical protein FVEN_g6525 [Fusarium venenatum]KAH6991958.1 hypothetical protein EDB82DRAFT_573732 [Fusarium venenatum]CEI60379.1 unnamed protein product [Fusarium venenatum]